MGRYRKHRLDEEELLRNNPDKAYVDAYRRMKRIKGFYIHLFVYLIFNTVIIATNYDEGERFWSWQTFSTALFWGIGLLGHGLSVFGRDFFFGKDWEERKIQQYMNKSKESKWE